MGHIARGRQGLRVTLSSGPAWDYQASVVTGIAPTSGTTAGGTAVTITGTDFVPGSTPRLSGVNMTSIVVVSSTTITAVTGAHSAGLKTLSILGANGKTSNLMTNAYTYT